MAFTIGEIAKILGGRGQIVSPEAPIRQLLTDSRNVSFGAESLFFAIPGTQHDGHAYIDQALQAGVRCFVVEKMPQKTTADANFILVPVAIRALQQVAAAHRGLFDIPVLGITGSNGKTIVKEWLNHLLQTQMDIVRSPRSYNSQIGVPLSVWEMDARHELGIFEAGISQPGEMEYLQKVIQPTIGLFTNIGHPHSEGFRDDAEKLQEKMHLLLLVIALYIVPINQKCSVLCSQPAKDSAGAANMIRQMFVCGMYWLMQHQRNSTSNFNHISFICISRLRMPLP
ncbi:MAG TPA: Mur ligase family protein [Chitinophagales bacterium]|nr:Mur ligase family protein [Chitinophagales bacterium]